MGCGKLRSGQCCSLVTRLLHCVCRLRGLQHSRARLPPREAVFTARAVHLAHTLPCLPSPPQDKTTISNIPAKDSMLWAHAVITWAVTFVVYWWLWK